MDYANSKDTIGNRTRAPPACIAPPAPIYIHHPTLYTRWYLQK